ncbi:MAG: hypothetical protein NZT92_19435, partial [Abditibacteriales bacterium]|nr:hypothetical protein [Abditibacteriales bacterium]MDW8367919.1 hypothetical protein [Abditibacteriales bacterium]
MTCENIREHYLDYMEQSLDPAAATEVESHLHECPTCARELTSLRWTVQTLRALPSVAPPADLRRRVQMQLLPETASPPEPFYQQWLAWLRPRRWAVPAALATGVVAMLLVAVALPSLRNRQLAEKGSASIVASAPPSSAPSAMRDAPAAALPPAREEPPVRIDVFPGRRTTPYTPR